MNDRCRWWCRVSGAALLGAGLISRGAVAAEEGPPSLEGPVASGELLPDTPPDADRPRTSGGPTHEAFLAPGSSPGRVRAPKSPPPPIVERPTDAPPDGQAQWVAGYWTWEPARNDFAWVAGAWRVAPPEKIWVNGRWQRDEQGWSRVPGFWSPRRTQVAATGPAPGPVDTATDWRTTGPPTSQPADEPGQPPGPDAFYIPGHHAPEGDRVVWKPGFWTRSRPGWEWLPARWVRRPSGWDYRTGAWVRDPATEPTPTQTVARPRAEGNELPPAIVESEPRRDGGEADRLPAAPPFDPIAGAEDEARGREFGGQTPPVVIVPGDAPYGYPGRYRYYAPVSPRAYIPWGVMPPFARRIVNRVLP